MARIQGLDDEKVQVDVQEGLFLGHIGPIGGVGESKEAPTVDLSLEITGIRGPGQAKQPGRESRSSLQNGSDRSPLFRLLSVFGIHPDEFSNDVGPDGLMDVIAQVNSLFLGFLGESPEGGPMERGQHLRKARLLKERFRRGSDPGEVNVGIKVHQNPVLKASLLPGMIGLVMIFHHAEGEAP